MASHPKELARSLALESSTVSELADRLERAKLIKRQRLLTDRRAVMLRPTAAGNRKAAKIHKDLNFALAAALAEIPAEQLAALEVALGSVRDTVVTVIDRITAS